MARAALPGLAVALLLTAGCAAGSGAMDGRDALTIDLQRHYEDHASERGGMCPRPRIRAITASEVVEESDDIMVLRVRYNWLDEGFTPPSRGLDMIRPDSCSGFATREFTLAKLGDRGLQVIDMSGETRERRQNFGVGGRS